MKTLFFFLFFFGVTAFCKAQTLQLEIVDAHPVGKYGYAYWQPKVKTGRVVYITAIKDLTRLDQTSVSRKNSYGTEKSWVVFYGDCLKKWLSDTLISQGIRQADPYNVTVFIQTVNQYAGCVYGNEDGCFMKKNDAESRREQAIAAFKSARINVVEVE